MTPAPDSHRFAAARTRVARGLTRFLPPEQVAKLEASPAGRAIHSGTYRIGLGVANGLLLDASKLDLSGVQAGGVVRGIHEMQVQEALRRTLPERGTFVDIGAHVGFMTLAGARLVGPHGRAVAIEPVPANAEAIRANAALNGFDHVTVIEAAASSTSGHAELITVEDTLWTRLASVGEHERETSRSTVRTVALDDLVSSGELPVPDVVKIDVEGAELDVIDGMRTTLAEGRTTILCEMHGKNRAYADLLDELGYRVSNLDGPGPIADAGGNDHAIATPVFAGPA